MKPLQVKLALLAAICMMVWIAPGSVRAAGNQGDQSHIKEDPGQEKSPEVSHAIAVLHPTRGQEVMGTIAFTQTPEGLRVKAQVMHLPSGQHAYHVHLYGDCSGPEGKSAGTHFNFNGPSKEPPDNIAQITGDLGQLEADANGNASVESIIKNATLYGPYAIIGRSVVVHAKPNDPSSPPMGDAGSRLACGVIGIAESS